MVSTRSLARRPRRLIISRFSAFDEVDISFPSLTIFTGPQASGKSLLCKLLFFFQEVFEEVLTSIQEGQSLAQFTKAQAGRFSDWFPPSAWGTSKFKISYEVDGLFVEALRVSGRGGVKDEITLKLSESLEAVYSEFSDLFEKSKKQVASREDQAVFIRSDMNYRFRADYYKYVLSHFSQSLTSSQTYVPASRAFFTTIGKAMSAFEHGQLLDPITKSFGRLYIGLVERMRHGFPISYRYYRGSAATGSRYRNNKMVSIFGGKPKMEKNEMLIEAQDGRLIPLFALSSGQQELLPLWLSLDYFDSAISYSEPNSGANFLYIEEPEAHLFPEAQAGVLEVLASLLRKPGSRSQMVLTTHSPYLLAKANNLLLAGKYGFRKREARQRAIDNIISKAQWLLPGDVACYGLAEGRAMTLIGDDGLISTDYIDQVSQDIVTEHEKLLDVVY